MKAGGLRQHKKWFGPATWLSCWSQVVASCPQYFAHKCVTQVARSASPFSGGHWQYTMPIYGPYMAHIWPIWRMTLRLGGFTASPTGPTVGVALWCALHTSCGREETLRSGCRTWCVDDQSLPTLKILPTQIFPTLPYSDILISASKILISANCSILLARSHVHGTSSFWSRCSTLILYIMYIYIYCIIMIYNVYHMYV